MIEVRETETYSKWFESLKDTQARARVLARVRRLALGNPGDVAPVGDGISELRIHYGPGYRVYFVQRGDTVVILLGGGDKSSQKSDIAEAKTLAKELRESLNGK
jgi:putative addiction module killer protein